MYTPDEDDDIDAADRGNDVGVVEDKEDTPDDTVEDTSRDDKGRFAKKGEKKEDKADKADEDDGEVGLDEDKDDGKVGEEKDEEEESPDDKNLGLRLNKAKEQRDRARDESARERGAREAAERELAALKGTKEPQKSRAELIQEQLDGMYEKVEELRADGNTAEAAKAQRTIDELNRNLVRMDAAAIAANTTSLSTANTRYNATADRLETMVPELNPNSEDFDSDTVDRLQYLTAAHEKMGQAPADALVSAALLLFPGLSVPKAEAAKGAPPKKDVKKALETAKKQPPDLSVVGVNREDPVLDVGEMTDDEWDAMPESKRARLRGDMG